MQIAIISDLHDNLINLKQCLDWCQKNRIEKIICCGDVGNQETISYLSANFSGEIFLVEGNAETHQLEDLKPLTNINFLGLLGKIELENLKIGFCHKEKDISRLVTETWQPDFIFYGHSHKPWLEKKGAAMIANPGNLAGIFFAPTFAVLNTEKKYLELKLLANL